MFRYASSLSLMICLACSGTGLQFPEPDEQPYILEQTLEIGGTANVMCADLNGDGRDEIVQWDPVMGGDPEHGALTMHNADRTTIDQVNFAGRIQGPVILDYGQDGAKELFVPFVLNDSLFVTAVDARGIKLFRVFLCTGEPRPSDGGALIWDPRVNTFYLSDVDGDGREELISVIVTGYARMPRGVFIHALPDGKLLNRRLLGAYIQRSYLDDVDGDGRGEIVLSSSAPDNGAEAGGFDDRHTYLIVLELLDLHIEWSAEMGGRGTHVELLYEDLDGDLRREFIAITGSASAQDRYTRFETIVPGAWRTTQRVLVSDRISYVHPLDIDADGRHEIIVLNEANDVWIMDHRFRELRRRNIGADTGSMSLSKIPDVDNDGRDEIVYTLDTSGFMLLNPDLSVKAALRDHRPAGVMQTQTRTPRQMVTKAGDRIVVFRLMPNRWYLVNRYGPAALWGMGLLVVAGLCLAGVSRWRRTLLTRQIQRLVVNAQEDGFALIDHTRRLRMANAVFSAWFADGSQDMENRIVEEVIAANPELVAYFQALRATPPHHREDMLAIPVSGHVRSFRVTADPITVGRKPAWFLRFTDRATVFDPHRARTWAIMAQRIAHDIKNPLTSILLNLQQLQLKYQMETPDHAADFDTHVSRMTERIESLRRMTRNFMKFTDMEAPNLVVTDLNALVAKIIHPIQEGLPDDLEIVFRSGEDMPGVHVDQEQIQSVLENLVSNAVNAMPRGGRITLTTSVARNLHLEHLTTEGTEQARRAQRISGGFPDSKDINPAAQDYILLEVRDTGRGIPASLLSDIFNPGVTTSERGGGLGLALVRKIVADHNGHVEVESEEGAGTVVSVYLPV